jgi:hypothetical protein
MTWGCKGNGRETSIEVGRAGQSSHERLQMSNGNGSAVRQEPEPLELSPMFGEPQTLGPAVPAHPFFLPGPTVQWLPVC